MNINNQKNGLTDSLALLMRSDTLDIRKIIVELRRSIRIIASVSIATFFIAFLYTMTLSPRYQTSALIQIKSQNMGSGIFGSIGSGMNEPSPIDIEIALMKTRYIMEPVVKENALNIVATPHYFPIIGKFMASRYRGNDVARPFLWFSTYTWGGEIISVHKFLVPANYIGHNFKLVAGINHHYQLYDQNGSLILSGVIGQNATSQIPGFLLAINELEARPNTEFTLTLNSPIKVAIDLANSLEVLPVNSSGSSGSTGILQLQLTGSNPQDIVKLLNQIVKFSVLKSNEQKIKDAQKSLDFFDQRLPLIKQDLEQAESLLNEYHKKNSTLNMTIVSQLLVTELTSVNRDLQKLRATKAELLQVYTPEHPLVQAAELKEAALQKKLDALKSEIRSFPFIKQQETNLEREVKIKNAMYISLLNNKEQAEAKKASTIPDVTALTDATPPTAIPLHKMIILLAGLLFGAIVSSIVVLIKSSFNKTIDDANQLENDLQIPVRCIVPFSKKQKQMQKAHETGISILGGTALPLILARREPDDISIESLRSLRVSLHIISPASQHPVIAIMGGLSNVGKSFVSLNLAQVIADSGKKTLLIDADIRKGQIHKNLMVQKSKGLSEYLEGNCNYENLIHQINENLFFIPCGIFNKQPSELFQHTRLRDLIDRCKKDFDQVIIDTPPVLPVIDAVLISQHCDLKLFVVSADRDTLSDVKLAINKAQTHDITINGLVFNHSLPISTYGNKNKYLYAYSNT